MSFDFWISYKAKREKAEHSSENSREAECPILVHSISLTEAEENRHRKSFTDEIA